MTQPSLAGRTALVTGRIQTRLVGSERPLPRRRILRIARQTTRPPREG